MSTIIVRLFAIVEAGDPFTISPLPQFHIHDAGGKTRGDKRRQGGQDLRADHQRLDG